MASEFLMVPPGWTRANMKPTEMWCGVDTAAPGVMDVTSFGDQVRQYVPGTFFTSSATNCISITTAGDTLPVSYRVDNTYGEWDGKRTTVPMPRGAHPMVPHPARPDVVVEPAVRKIATDQDLGEAVQDALGFAGHSVKSIDLRVAAGEIVTATVEVHVHKEEAAKLAGIFSKQVKLKAVVTGERIVE